jgi:hypothetical protein
VLDEIATGADIPEGERQDLATSLVRQWLTYGGRATLFFGECQVYLVLGKTPLGRRCVHPEPAPPGWIKQLTRRWNVSPADLPDVIDRLNRGQSAEVVTSDGIPLRLWVNPKEKSRGVEPLVQEGLPVPVQAPPALCPTCLAVLSPWQDGECQQTCSHCGHRITLSRQPAEPVQMPPAFCPTCTAVLRPWREGEHQQTCWLCGHTILLS